MLNDDTGISENRIAHLNGGQPSDNGNGNDNGLAEKPGDDSDVGEASSKKRILYSAAALFATKGFTETPIRELAAAAGLKASSVYNHFKSKTAILEYMLADYMEPNSGAFFNETTRVILEENPTTDGILSCLQTVFSGENAAYYFNVLSMTMQEQHRNPVIREYIKGDILKAERHTEIIINILKQMGILKQETDPDYWMKLISCVFYTFSNRAVLGNGDRSPDYKGLSMEGLLRRIFDDLLSQCCVDNKS